MATTAELLAALKAEQLVALGVTVPNPAFCSAEARSLVLIGPQGGRFWWHHVTTSSEWRDGTPDPVDRWSKRVLGALAKRFGGAALFPSDGPPWPPFIQWALASGTIWQSPVGMLVHADTGLWISFRGALALPFSITLPAAANPCESCAEKPCRSACPVVALGPNGYDIAACHGFLDSPPGQNCMTGGCAARRACPAGRAHARLPEQSAYHMSRFHP